MNRKATAASPLAPAVFLLVALGGFLLGYFDALAALLALAAALWMAPEDLKLPGESLKKMHILNYPKKCSGGLVSPRRAIRLLLLKKRLEVNRKSPKRCYVTKKYKTFLSKQSLRRSLCLRRRRPLPLPLHRPDGESAEETGALPSEAERVAEEEAARGGAVTAAGAGAGAGEGEALAFRTERGRLKWMRYTTGVRARTDIFAS